MRARELGEGGFRANRTVWTRTAVHVSPEPPFHSAASTFELLFLDQDVVLSGGGNSFPTAFFDIE